MKLALIILSTFVIYGWAVDRSNFKTCDQSSFCRRCRKVAPGNSQFELVASSVNTYSDSITADLQNKENGHAFSFKLQALKDNTFHVQIDEKNGLKPRYRVVDALKGAPLTDKITVHENSDKTLTVSAGNNKAIVFATPFRIDFYTGDQLTLSANAKGLMRFEHIRTKPPPPVDGEDPPADQVKKSIEDEDPGAWEENFKSHHDSKPNGPEAVALDFTFNQANVLFGIPEHADSFALRHTVGSEPYRLYNLDVFEYELNNGMALYGAIPVIYGHGTQKTVGVFWQNAAETWVDIHNSAAEKNVLSSIVNMVAGSKDTDAPAAHFMSESGIIDAYILMGPTPGDTFKQYTDLTGTAPLPQMFALAHHQCRWNYNDEDDVNSVSENFDKYDIPMDTMWLDIEYTDSKKYFTWDQHKFPNSLEMIKNLTDKGRHLTVIIDPHIKRDNNYFFHNDCQDRGYYTKNKDGNDYEGYCWPGPASYPDLFNPEVRKYFAEQYSVENFKGTTEDVMIWNDMNEPSVFNGPEITMLKDNLHFGGWEHRDVHNLYGHMQIMSTYDGLVKRSNGKQRPFILTRSHFAGSQRFATIWTGDNMASWDHLVISIPMCLSEAVAGYSFCGADVGGFFGNPDAELFERWYQAGAFLPFFRTHAHLDTKRREPWLFPEETRLTIRDAIRKRYSYLPLWYTLFYEHERTGLSVIRPLLMHYPTDKETFNIDYEFLVGHSLLVRPVMQAGVSTVNVYFPTKSGEQNNDIWYDTDTFTKYERPGYYNINVNSRKIPVFQRGGSIVPKKERIRRASTLMINDPYTFIVCLDQNNEATGTLYTDDEKSFEYRQGNYIYQEVSFKNNVLSNKFFEKPTYQSQSWLERVIIAGLNRVPKSATLVGSQQPELTVITQDNVVIIRKPGVRMNELWKIQLNY